MSPPGLEPGTRSLKGCRSNRLSYGPTSLAMTANYTSIIQSCILYTAMPELPEVETIVRRMREPLIGKVINDVSIFKEKSFRGDFNKIIGREIQNISRKAKLIHISFSGNQHILVHLKMTGQLIYVDQDQRLGGGHPTKDWVLTLPSKHTRIEFSLNNSAKLFFNDMRIFGWVKQCSDEEVAFEFSKYAPDINTNKITPKYLLEKIQNRRIPIKVAILDSKIVSGMGNIYANDALHLAKIHPAQPANSLSLDEVSELIKAMQAVIELGIKSGGATIDNFRDIHGFSGSYQTKVRVYGKLGEPCQNCGTLIEKTKLGGRGTFFCPNCQSYLKSNY